jgi:hypothetical protein
MPETARSPRQRRALALVHHRRGNYVTSIQSVGCGGFWLEFSAKKTGQKNVGEIVGSVVEFGGSPHSERREEAVMRASLKPA